MSGYSFTEVEAVLTKAARGSGAGVAHATRFGKAGALCLRWNEGAGLVNAALAELPSGVIVEHATRIQRDLNQASGNEIIFPDGDALWEGYVVSLPYKTEQNADGSFRVLFETYCKPERPTRLYISDQDMGHWQVLASMTYVPETEKSRIAGAGAGLTDND